MSTEFSACLLADWRETNSCIHVHQEGLSRPSPGTDELCSIRGEREQGDRDPDDLGGSQPLCRTEGSLVSVDNPTARDSLLQAGLSSKSPGMDRRGGKQPKHLSSGDSCPQRFSPRRLWADISRSGHLPPSPWSDWNENAPSPPSGLAVLHLITLAGILCPERRAESLAVCSGGHTAHCYI